MIISRAPVRLSLGGGGTDLPGYYAKFGGYVITAAIDCYVYVTANKRFYQDIRLAYSRTEIVPDVASVRHRTFREALRISGVSRAIELTSVADVPSASGLGTTASFTVALLNALHTFKREFVSSRQLADEACQLEAKRPGGSRGKQDAYAAAFGNLIELTVSASGEVEVGALPVLDRTLDELQHNLVVVHSGIDPAPRTPRDEPYAEGELESVHRIKALGHEVRRVLVDGDIDRYGEILDEQWSIAKQLPATAMDDRIEEHYEAIRRAGAMGGKLVGDGRGGFFMFYVRPSEKRRAYEAMLARGLRPLRFRFDRDGARIVANIHRA